MSIPLFSALGNCYLVPPARLLLTSGLTTILLGR